MTKLGHLCCLLWVEEVSSSVKYMVAWTLVLTVHTSPRESLRNIFNGGHLQMKKEIKIWWQRFCECRLQ